MFTQSNGRPDIPVHHVHMAKKPTKKPEGLKPTFLRAWRDQTQLSLETAAEHLGMTHGQLSKIERGKSPYNQRLLESAAKLYGCTVVDLLTRGPDEAEGLFAAYANLDSEGKRQAARLVGALRPSKR